MSRIRTLNHFAFFRFTDAYYALDEEQKAPIRAQLLAGLREAAERVDIYQVYPARHEHDIMVWSACNAEDVGVAAEFFQRFAQATNPLRRWLTPTFTMWGFTKPSIYSRSERSAQEIDPFAEERKRYMVVYPFVKTVDWYLLRRDTRQGMMNEHIRIGKQYPQIIQLLLYSFGLADQEFIVTYETDDLNEFSDLVMELRGSDARKYTERDTPIFTAVYHPAEETLALF
ncbi:MAG: hypothetical protein D6802_01295 [Ardenticatenia bacterium]|nr:MAG: hypothetical protein D6802_01295 [Ardenticatenia bacterium]